MVGPFTEVHNTPNKSVRQNVARLGVVLHHAAMTDLDTLIYLEMGAKQVSSSATCKDDRLPQMMPFDVYRAWSLSDAYWDSALRSVETCNQSVDGWTVSDASHWSLAKAVAYWAELDGFWPHRDGDPETWTVLGHREMYIIHDASYATACPGGMDLNLVTSRAQEILNSGTAGGGGTPIDNTYTIEENDDMPEPIYAKGSTNAAVYAIYTNAGANNPQAALQGNVYCARRKVEAGEYAAVRAVGFPNVAQKDLVVIPQGDFDKIPKVFGSV